MLDCRSEQSRRLPCSPFIPEADIKKVRLRRKNIKEESDLSVKVSQFVT